MIEKLLVRLVGDGSSYAKMMTDASKQADKFESAVKTAAANASTAINNIGTSVKNVGKRMALGITLPVAAAGVGAIKAATDLNKLMANVASLGVGSDHVVQLKKDVQGLSIATGKSTTDLAAGLYDVVSAFEATSETSRILDIEARAATAGVATTADALRLTSGVTKAYGDTSADAIQKVADLSFIAVKLGQTTFPDLAASIGRVAPLTKELGVSQEELFAVMATATGVTGGAAEVSTQLRGIMQSLMAPSDDMVKLFRAQGFESGKAMIAQLGLAGTIKSIIDRAEETGNPLQKFMGSIEGQTLALALSGSQSEVYAKKLEATMNSVGSLDEAFKQQTEGINAAGFAWEQAKQKIVVLAQRIGDVLIPIIGQVISFLEPWIKKFTTLGAANQRLIVAAIILAAALGPILIIVGMLISAAASLIPIIAGVGGALVALVGGPIGVAIAAVVALIAGVKWLGGSWTETGKLVGRAIDFMVEAFITSVRIFSRVVRAFVGWVGARFFDLFQVDFVSAVKSGIKIAMQLLEAFTIWVAKKISSLLTGGTGPGDLNKFLDELTGDLQKGASNTNFLETIADITKEETGRFQQRREGESILNQDQRGRLQPFQSKVTETKDDAKAIFMKQVGLLDKILQVEKQQLNKPIIDTTAVGL